VSSPEKLRRSGASAGEAVSGGLIAIILVATGGI
jgi:hypothetical protein